VQSLIERLGLGAEHTLIEIGAGTGTFAVPAAKICKRVYVVDVSTEMLRRAGFRIDEADTTGWLADFFCTKARTKEEKA
jgi:ubiquinone/menaquinone biosynthesis C-methylase UbiE